MNASIILVMCTTRDPGDAKRIRALEVEDDDDIDEVDGIEPALERGSLVEPVEEEHGPCGSDG